MDARRFDGLTKAWGTRTGRRETLRLAAIGLLALWTARRGETRADAQDAFNPGACVLDEDCQDGDGSECTGASCLGGMCAYFVVDCMPGYVCCGNGACCPSGGVATCAADADCVTADPDPCVGAKCLEGACAPYILTCAPDHTCLKGACVPIGFAEA